MKRGLQNSPRHPTGLEAGIDGYIEIRDQQSGEVNNCIVQVQSKVSEQPLSSDQSGTVSAIALRRIYNIGSMEMRL